MSRQCRSGFEVCYRHSNCNCTTDCNKECSYFFLVQRVASWSPHWWKSPQYYLLQSKSHTLYEKDSTWISIMNLSSFAVTKTAWLMDWFNTYFDLLCLDKHMCTIFLRYLKSLLVMKGGATVFLHSHYWGYSFEFLEFSFHTILFFLQWYDFDSGPFFLTPCRIICRQQTWETTQIMLSRQPAHTHTHTFPLPFSPNANFLKPTQCRLIWLNKEPMIESLYCYVSNILQRVPELAISLQSTPLLSICYLSCVWERHDLSFTVARRLFSPLIQRRCSLGQFRMT